MTEPRKVELWPCSYTCRSASRNGCTALASRLRVRLTIEAGAQKRLCLPMRMN
jgi:hypothetical protein